MSGSGALFLLRPKWIAFHLVVAGSIAAMLWLAFWQLDRLDERREFNARVAEQIEQPPVPFDQLLAEAGDDPESIEWRQAIVAGTYLPDQVVWFNRSQDGVAGDNVLSPLVVDGGPTVVVNRGFVALGTEVPQAPSAAVEILARVRIPQERQRGELTDANDGTEPVTEVRRVDLDLLASQLPGDLAPVYLDLIDSIPAVGAGDPVPVPPPTLDEGPHLSYAAQWFIFSLCVASGWVLAVRWSLRTHRRSSPITVAADEPTQPGSDRRGDAVSAGSTTGTDAPSPH